ncbi:MAG: tryptophan--tRNA ligase [Pseudomonadota bacterium]
MTARSLSGIQPSGRLHLGNYFGAIRQHIAKQDDAFYFIANYHAQTTVFDAETLRRYTLETAASYLALGLDPERATLFRQSDVPQVTELMWLLTSVTGKGLLDRAVSYKDRVAQGVTPSLGLYMYPVLMAADILAYDSDIVPVGSDQVQHIEMCRDMAGSFNNRYGDTFKIPDYEIGTPVPVKGVDGRKMSKSYDNTIPIFDTAKALKKKVMSITTDSKGLDEPKDPDTCNVFDMYKLMASEEELETMAANYRRGGYGYGAAKKELLRLINETFGDATERYFALLNTPDDIEDALQKGAEKARAAATKVLNRARAASGL